MSDFSNFYSNFLYFSDLENHFFYLGKNPVATAACWPCFDMGSIVTM